MALTHSNHFRIVLVRPRNPNNIGAAARAMANFGLDDLVVVDPHEPVWRESQTAVGAEGVMRRARRLSLDQAIGDCALALATTTARRRELRRPLVSLPEIHAFLSERNSQRSATIAILFGSEKTGLTNRELERCHAWIQIPTRSSQPSMNLGQAVAVIAYELDLRDPTQAHRAKSAATPSSAAPPTTEQMEDLIRKSVAAFRSLDYKNKIPEAALAAQFRDSFLHWRLRRKDAAMLQALFKRVAGRRAAS